MEILPNWHPMFVHFSIGLWTAAVVIYLITLFFPQNSARVSLLTVARWNLWIGTAVSLLTVAAGVFAYNTVAHDTPSHEVMNEHRMLALGTFGLFLLLSGGVWFRLRAREGHPGIVFSVLAVLALALLLDTGWHGAELVYRHGLGVRSLPRAEHTAPKANIAAPNNVDTPANGALLPIPDVELQPHTHDNDHEHTH